MIFDNAQGCCRKPLLLGEVAIPARCVECLMKHQRNNRIKKQRPFHARLANFIGQGSKARAHQRIIPPDPKRSLRQEAATIINRENAIGSLWRDMEGRGGQRPGRRHAQASACRDYGSKTMPEDPVPAERSRAPSDVSVGQQADQNIRNCFVLIRVRPDGPSADICIGVFGARQRLRVRGRRKRADAIKCR